METLEKPMLKTFTYGLMHLTVAIMVAYALTRDIRAALAIGLLEPLVQTFAYSLHERLWRKVRDKGDGDQLVPSSTAV